MHNSICSPTSDYISKEECERSMYKANIVFVRDTTSFLLAKPQHSCCRNYATYTEGVEEEGQSSRNLRSLCPHAIPIKHVHCAGSGQLMAFFDQ